MAILCTDPPVDIMSQATGIEAVGAASSGSISIESKASRF